jgi:peptidoglycan-associated lipoprotein
MKVVAENTTRVGSKRTEPSLSRLVCHVTDSQVEAVSFGKEKPAVAGFDQDSMARNRRAGTYR